MSDIENEADSDAEKQYGYSDAEWEEHLSKYASESGQSFDSVREISEYHSSTDDDDDD